MLDVLLNLGEFSTHRVFYMPTCTEIFCLLSCASHTWYGRVFFSRESHLQIELDIGF